MKKTLLLSGLLLCGLTHAQETKKTKLDIKPYLGMGISQAYSGDASKDARQSTRPTYGVMLDFYFNEDFSLQTGVMMEDNSAVIYKGGARNQFKLNYTTIPFAANWHLGKNKQFDFSLGMAFSFLNSAELTTGGKTTNVSDAMRDFQFGVQTGIGYRVPVTETFTLTMGAVNTLGLTKATESSSPVSFRNSHSTIYLGTVINLN